MKIRRSVTIDINLREAGHGYKHSVKAARDGDKVEVSIIASDTTYAGLVTATFEEWIAVRDAMDAAIKMVGAADTGVNDPPPKSRTTFEEVRE